MTISENVVIAPYTTFKIGGPARFFCIVTNDDELVEAVTFAKEKAIRPIVLGGGSNVLFSDDGFNGLIIKNEMMGKTFTDDGTLYSVVDANAGEDWEELVALTVEKDLFGLENLSSIPGKVGAAPVQNIGAYGAEVGKVVASVRVLDTETMKFVELSFVDCKFSYRDSIFKHEKGRYIVTKVRFRLCKQGEVNIGYKDLAHFFADRKIAKPSLKEVRNAIIEIRKNKLPDWKVWGTAGSFFKNPIVTAEVFAELQKKYPELPGYPESDGRVKVSLGWILDKVCDAKGLTLGNVSTYEKQALVLVAKPGATATEVINFSNELMKRVREKTGIIIEGEVELAVV